MGLGELYSGAAFDSGFLQWGIVGWRCVWASKARSKRSGLLPFVLVERMLIQRSGKKRLESGIIC